MSSLDDVVNQPVKKPKKKKESNSRRARCGRACDAIRETAQTLRNAAEEVDRLISEHILEEGDTVDITDKDFKDMATEVDVGELEELKDELQGWFDNLPEGLQQADTGSRLEEAVGNLESACDTITSVEIPEAPTGEADEAALSEFKEKLEEAADEIEAGADEAEGTDFPGMYGK